MGYYQINSEKDFSNYIDKLPKKDLSGSRLVLKNICLNVDFDECIMPICLPNEGKVIIFSNSIINVAFNINSMNGFSPICSSFINVQFNEEVNISNAIFKENFILSKCKFEKRFTILNVTFNLDVSFYENIFHSYISFFDVDYIQNWFISKGSTFLEDVKFSNVHFHKVINFSRQDFSKNLDFQDVTFHDNFFCLNSNVGGTLYFIRCKIENANVFLDDSIIGQLYISSTIFPSILSLCKIHIDSTNIDHTYLEKVPMFMSNAKIKSDNRETARFLKNESYKANDSVLALQFRSQEMSLYSKELKQEKSMAKGFCKKFDYWGDRILLWLNTYSNNNGVSWLRGLAFTLSVWLIFFSIFAVLKDGWGKTFIWLDRYYLKEAFKYFWNYFGIFKDFNDLDFNIPIYRLIPSIIVYFLGKIAIAYGIYQTIAAFRKYRR